MHDVIVIGAGLSGLTAASLLAKRGLHVAVIDKGYCPGGSCGAFKRSNVLYDQGSSMLFGFGERGFNAHRFVFNCLEEPFEVVRHELLYCVNFRGHRIRFWADIDRFVEELATVFPADRASLRRFYRDVERLYHHVIAEDPAYSTPDETDPRGALRNLLRHPVSYARFLSFLNRSAESLLKRYFTNPELLQFFDKLTSTYCYTTLAESPAVLATVMFIDNHVGGSYYPAGSTLFLPGKLEKVIEEHGGDMYLDQEVTRLLFDGDRPAGVLLAGGTELRARYIVYSGTVANLYAKLLPAQQVPAGMVEWAVSRELTYPSVVLYAHVDRSAIPAETAPVEMLVGNPAEIDESEVTVYVPSIDDHTICGPDGHVVIAIGPSFRTWADAGTPEYSAQKAAEQERLIEVLARRFPGFRAGLRYAEVATPRTIERYTLKNGGSVAGPKQKLGQHMLRRQHTRTRWENLFCCGEGTVLGTGTPAVTTSGISAANALLRRAGLEPFRFRKGMRDYVRVVERPVTAAALYAGDPPELRAIRQKAFVCQFCEHPTCSTDLDIRGLLRRLAVGNTAGAGRIASRLQANLPGDQLGAEICACEARCVLRSQGGLGVEIRAAVDYALACDTGKES